MPENMSLEARTAFFTPDNLERIKTLTGISYARHYATLEKTLDIIQWAVQRGLYSESMVTKFVVGYAHMGGREDLSLRRQRWFFSRAYSDPLTQADPWDLHAYYLVSLIRQAIEATSKGGPGTYGEFVEELMRGPEVSWVYQVHYMLFTEQIALTGEFERIRRSQEATGGDYPIYKRWMKEIWPIARPYYDKWKQE